MASRSRSSNDSAPSQVYTPLQIAEMKTGRRVGQIRRAPGFSGRKRMKIDGGGACYHVMSRTVNGELLFGALEKEAFRRMMWRMAQFSGVEILTYAVMGNHFHILLKVPERQKWLRKFEGPDGEEKLLAHLAVVYSKAFIAQLRREITQLRERGDEDAISQLLARFKDRFCDLSLFVKELKERFSRWYNKQNDRRGTLWMDRFKSVLVENGPALETMAAYIDLNPVRAGLVDDPAHYQWSGYGEATAGSRRARRGLCKITDVPQDAWETHGQRRYRIWLYTDGLIVPEDHPPQSSSSKKRPPKKGFTMKQMIAVRTQESEKIPPQLLVRQRQRSLTTGVALGSADFVKTIATHYRTTFARQRTHPGKPLTSPDHKVYTLRE